MPYYDIKIDLNSISLYLEADDEQHAFKLAYEIALGETSYDLLKWANYNISEAQNE